MATRNSSRAKRGKVPARKKSDNVPTVNEAMGALDEAIQLITAASLAFRVVLEHKGHLRVESYATASAITVVTSRRSQAARRVLRPWHAVPK